MGFFDFLGGADPAPTNEHPEGTSPSEQTRSFHKDQESTFPVVTIQSAKTHVNGTKMQVYCQLVNKWDESVRLDRIQIFGVVRRLDAALRPGETREFLTYDGAVLTHEYHEIELDYKTEHEGDYFRAVHDATFTYHPEDKTYTVSNITLHHPIRDIYG